MSDNLRVGIVGFGGAGLAQLRHFNAIPGCQVMAVYDPNPDGLKRAGARRLAATDNFQHFLELIDVVAVCSPDSTHADYIVRSLGAGKHVVCEKPLCDTLEGCREVLKAEKQAPQCVASVQHQMRFLPVHLKMKEIIKRGELGRISYIEGYYVHDLRERASLYDRWRFTQNATPLVYSGCHFIDLLRWLLDDEAEEVMAMANNLAFPEYPESDLNVILLRFRSGIIGKIVVAFGAGRPQDHSVRVYGTEQCIENNLLFDRRKGFKVFAKPQVETGTWPGRNPLRRLRHLAHHWSPAIIGRLIETLMKLQGNKHPNYSVNSYPFRLYEHDAAVRASLESFVESVRGRKTVSCSLTEASRTVVTCLAGVDSYRNHRPVHLSDYWLPEFGPL